MPGYRARYVRERYVKRDIRRDLYERLVRWCGEASVNLCLEKALSVLEANITPSAGADQSKPGPGGRPEPAAASTSKVVTTAGNVTRAGGNAAGGGYEWCRPRSSIKNLEGYIKWVDSRFGLVDWWEEGDDRICFETRRRPAKTE